MSVSAYRVWRTYSVKIGGRAYDIATKPGAFAYGRLDPATLLLAEHVDVKDGDTVVHMNCGNGLVGAVASLAGKASRVLLTDRSIVSVDAARRTLVANGVRNGEALLGHGAQALPTDVEADSVAIRIPQERLALLQLLVDAFSVLKIGGRCYIAGATNEGIKTAATTIEKLFGNARVLSRDSSHRVVSAVKRSESPASAEGLDSPFLERDAFNELDVTLRGKRYKLYSRPGVFSWDHVDEATTILAEVMQIREGDAVLDIGCGSGALGVVAASLSGHGPITMVDADVEAVRSATRSADANGLVNYRALTSDVAGAVLGERFDVVVTNPPFHVGKATDLNVPLQFIHDAWEVLVHGGRLFLVANRTLPYEQAIKHRFGNVANLHDGPRFKVLTATRGSD
jgi:16S rRNA (guanine1207-N2)-methyltransferase